MQKQAEEKEDPLLAEERRRRILEVLRRDGKVVATDLSATLAVSEDTIRRDLRELADAGLLQRVHGGALPRTPSHPQYTIRQAESTGAKLNIARSAAGLVRPGQVIILDAGTTTLQVAEHLPLDLRATVVTNSPPVALALADHQSIEVIVVGGQMYKPSRANMGGAALDALASIRADLCFLGVAGIHPEAGVSILVHEEVFVKRVMVDGAREVIAVAAAEKIGTVAPYIVGPLDILTRIVTELAAPDDMIALYERSGVQVIRA